MWTHLNSPADPSFVAFYERQSNPLSRLLDNIMIGSSCGQLFKLLNRPLNGRMLIQFVGEC